MMRDVMKFVAIVALAGVSPVWAFDVTGGCNNGDECDCCFAVNDAGVSGNTCDNGGNGDDTSCTFNDTIDEYLCYTACFDGNLTVSLCGSNYDTALAIFDGCGGAELGCNDDSCGLQSVVTIPVTMGQELSIRVSGFNDRCGDYTLSITGGVDSDGDGVCDAFDVCNNTPTGIAIDDEGRPLSDLDLDCDSDLDDFVLFQQWFTGPLAPLGVIIETVPVGNLGNADDTWADGFAGGVAYPYNIGKYEVTAGQYTNFLNAVAATDTYGLYNPTMDSNQRGCQITQNGSDGSYTYDFSGRPSGTEADWLDRPVNYISWGDAARFANWLHNGQPIGAQDLNTTEDGSYFLDGAISTAELVAVVREPDATWVIPSEDEWYKAAYHKNDGVTGNYFDYPTSSNSQPGYVNDSGNLSGTGTPFTEGGTDPGNYATFDGDGNTNGIGSPYYQTEVGEWENSDSPYGTSDQGGNVWEWHDDTLLAPTEVLFRCIRGGAHSSDFQSLLAFYRVVTNPNSTSHHTGFRVAELP